MCNHERWQYCRVVLHDGSNHFAAQCLDCLTLIKLKRHNEKLFLLPHEIPENATIHAYIQQEGGES